MISASGNETTRLSDSIAGSTSRISDNNIVGSGAAMFTNLSDGSPIVLNGQRYVIVKHITSSGEAEIYLMTGDNGQVVLKYYFSNYKPKDDIINRLHALKRRDIMSPLDSGIYQDRFFEITEYMSGGTMDSLMPLRDVSLIKKYAALVTEALKACHDNGIIHRDIKPVNIFFRSPAKDEIALGDFGISSALQAGADYRFTNSVNRTTAYAAPELFTNINNQTTLDKKVDYYALGISFLELWLGADPFKDMAEFMAMRIKIEGRVAIPAEMDAKVKDLIKGLIATEPPTRWGYEEVQRWIAGEYVKVHETSAQKTFEPYEWDDLNDVIVTDPKVLASLMDADRKKAVRQLYSRSIADWVKNNSQDMYSELLYIVEKEFPNNTAENADAGVTKAIYTLDRERSFKGFDGTICDSISEIARHIEANFDRYLSVLTKPSADLYLFFETRGFDDRTKKYLKYFGKYSPKRALNLMILDLDDNNLVLAGKTYDSVQALAVADDDTIAYIVKQVADIDSKVSLWLAITYHNLEANISAWRQNTTWQSPLTLGYALTTSGFKLNGTEATDAAGFYAILVNNLDDIIRDNDIALLADHWLRNYQNSSLYVQLAKLLAEKSITADRLISVVNLMLTLPEGQTADVIVAPELLRHITTLAVSDQQRMADLSVKAFKNVCEHNKDILVYRLDALEAITAFGQKLKDVDMNYCIMVLSKFNDLISEYTLADLKKMQKNSDTFFTYYNRLTKFYLEGLKPMVPDMPALMDFEKKKLIIDQKKQEITAKYDNEEMADIKKIQRSYSKYGKSRESEQLDYQGAVRNYLGAFWLTSSVMILYLIELFDVGIFEEMGWLMGFFVSIMMSLVIAMLASIAYYVAGWFQMRSILGKLLLRPIINDPNSRIYKEIKDNQRIINDEREFEMTKLDKRTEARINNDLFTESIKVMLVPAQS